MSHQHHFLSRLDRLTLPEVELALSLYRDPDLVDFLLRQANLPDGAERVALSLNDPHLGPFLVVTRDGVFVTCLGHGMSTKDLPIVTRLQLDAYLTRAKEQLYRTKAFIELSEEFGGTTGVFRRLYEAEDNVSREEMAAIASLQPLFEFELFRILMDVVMFLDRSRETLLPLVRRANKLRPDHQQLLRIYWKAACLSGHLSILCGLSGPDFFRKIPAQMHTDDLYVMLPWGSVRQGNVSFAHRGAWFAGRLGPVLVPADIRNLPQCTSQLTSISATLTLLAIACRHPEVRPEVEEALMATIQQKEGQDEKKVSYPGTPAAFATLMLKTYELDPEALEEVQFKLGSTLVMQSVTNVPKDSPYHFERAEDVPRDLAFAMATHLGNSLLTSHVVLDPLFAIVPWLARASAEDLYLPRDYIRATRAPWTPESTYNLLRPLATLYKPAPKQAEGPARKGPCPCGSGEKYKRCCGAST